jgi:hypothetical protein
VHSQESKVSCTVQYQGSLRNGSADSLEKKHETKEEQKEEKVEEERR